MDDLISRAAAIQICKSNVPNTNPNFYNLKSKAGYDSWMYSNVEACAIIDIEREIEKLPAIDAIPVEWLNKQCEMADDRGDMEMTDAISWLIQTWQEELEAR